jgi:hypothetical protein
MPFGLKFKANLGEVEIEGCGSQFGDVEIEGCGGQFGGRLKSKAVDANLGGC